MSQPLSSMGKLRLALHFLKMAWYRWKLGTRDFDSGLGESAWLLYGLTRAMRPAVSVEIGSARGLSTCCIALALRENLEGKLYAIDPHTQTEWNDAGTTDTHATLLRHLNEVGVRNWVEVLRQSSEEAGTGWVQPIDLLFIDGDHSRQGVQRDWELFSPHVTPGGVVIFHDTMWEMESHPFDVRDDLGVPGFVEHLRQSGYPMVTFDRNYGLTIVQTTRGGRPLLPETSP